MITEPTESVTPKARASPGWIFPAGIGRLRVRIMMASISASHHMFRQPDAPPPTAIISSDTNATTG
jgi:hypothetical protein